MEDKYKNESLVDVAYDILKLHPGEIAFRDLFNLVAEKTEMTLDRKDATISGFFTNLSLDGRFVTLKNNEWDLRERHTFDKVHVDLNAIYEDIEEDSSVAEDELEDEDEKNLHLGDEDDEENSGSNEGYYDDSNSSENY